MENTLVQSLLRQLEDASCESSRLRAQLHKEFAKTRKLEHELQRVKSDRALLETQAEEFHYHLENECLGIKLATSVGTLPTPVAHDVKTTSVLPADAKVSAEMYAACSSFNPCAPSSSRVINSINQHTPQWQSSLQSVHPALSLSGAGTSMIDSNTGLAKPRLLTPKKKSPSPPTAVPAREKIPDRIVIDLVKESSDEEDSAILKACAPEHRHIRSLGLESQSSSTNQENSTIPDGTTVSSTLRPNSASPSSQNARPETLQSAARQEQCEAVVPARALEEAVPESNGSLQVQDKQTVIENNSQPSGLVQRNAQDEEDLEYFSNPEDNEAPPTQAEDAKADDAAHTPQIPIVNKAVIEDECRVALGNLKHPQLMSFSDKFPTDILYSRLGKDNLMLYPITSDAHIVKKEVSRSQFREACGKSQGPDFLRVPTEMRLGYSRVMFPILDNNPFLPQVPGAPGLYFASRDTSRWPKEKEMVVVRYCENKCNVMGEYDMKPTKPLTGSEFEKLPADFRTAWVAQIRYKELYRDALTSIYLRNHLGREPSREEIEIKSSDRSFSVEEVLSSDIEMAIIRGEEKVNVWTMKCVGYDEGYKRRMLTHIHKASTERKRRASLSITEMLAELCRPNLARPSRTEEKRIPFAPPESAPVPSRTSPTGHKRQRRVDTDDESYKEPSEDESSSGDDIYKGLPRRRRRPKKAMKAAGTGGTRASGRFELLEDESGEGTALLRELPDLSP